MLIKFSVSNFKSINAKQEFSMIAGASRYNPTHVANISNVKILKETAFYGANAGGKTSLIQSIDVSKGIILSGTNYPQSICDSYCRNDKSNKDKETFFEYLFELNGRMYYYGFEIILSKREITREWLYEFNPILSKDQIVFDRQSNMTRFGDYFEMDERSRLEIYLADIIDKKNTLLLSEISNKRIEPGSNLQIFKDVMKWYTSKLFINGLPMPKLESYLETAKMMDLLDTDITGFKIINMKTDESADFANMLKEIEKYFSNEKNPRDILLPGAIFTKTEKGIKAQEICMVHKYSDDVFHMMEESTGTIQAITYLPLLTPSDNDCTYIFDEYGSSMHPLLAYKFIEMYQNNNRDNKNQLIIATHQMTVMSSELFRHDEIWFAEKKNGETEIYSLDDFEIRSDKKIDKAYLEGRFGALPILKDSTCDFYEDI